MCVVSWLCLAIALCFLLCLLCFFDFGVVVEGGVIIDGFLFCGFWWLVGFLGFRFQLNSFFNSLYFGPWNPGGISAGGGLLIPPG